MKNPRFFLALVEFLPARALVYVEEFFDVREWLTGFNPMSRRFARQRYN